MKKTTEAKWIPASVQNRIVIRLFRSASLHLAAATRRRRRTAAASGYRDDDGWDNHSARQSNKLPSAEMMRRLVTRERRSHGSRDRRIGQFRWGGLPGLVRSLVAIPYRRNLSRENIHANPVQI